MIFQPRSQTQKSRSEFVASARVISLDGTGEICKPGTWDEHLPAVLMQKMYPEIDHVCNSQCCLPQNREYCPSLLVNSMKFVNRASLLLHSLSFFLTNLANILSTISLMRYWH